MSEAQIRDITKGKEHNPLYLPRMGYSATWNIHGFAILAKNAPGSLSKIFEKIASEGVNVIAVEGGVPEDSGEAGTMFLLVNLSASRLTAKQLESVLKQVDMVESVRHVEPLMPGFVIDNHHFPLVVAGTARCFIVTELMWKSFLMSGYDGLGVNVTKIFLSQLGESMGRASVQSVRKMFTVNAEELIRIVLRQGTSMGWWRGAADMYLARNYLQITLFGNWEGEYSKKWMLGCSFTLAFWRGALSEIFDRSVALHEVKCISKGDDACVFKI